MGAPMNTNAAPATTTYWVKQILAEGRYTASADGVSREFTPALLTRIVENFDPNPNNEVPLMFSDPTGLQRGLNRAGTLTGLEFRPTEHGVWGHFDLLPEGADYVSRYPQFGVSAHVNNDLRIEYLIGTVVPAITGMDGWERAAPAAPWEDLTTDLQSAEEEPEQESQYEEVSLDLSEPQPQPQPQLNRGSRVKTAQSQRAELIAELKRYGIDVTANGRPASDDLLVHLAQKCRAGLVNQARSEYRTGMAQHRVRLQNPGTDTHTKSRTADLSYSNPQEGNTMSAEGRPPTGATRTTTRTNSPRQ